MLEIEYMIWINKVESISSEQTNCDCQPLNNIDASTFDYHIFFFLSTFYMSHVIFGCAYLHIG